MNNHPSHSPRMRKPTLNSARRRIISLASLLVLSAMPSSSTAQQPPAQTTPQAKATASRPAPENQPPSTEKTATARTGSITGRILGDDGHPIANATVIALRFGASTLPTGGTTDADGRFEVKDLRPGAYRVEAIAPGYILLPDAGAETGASNLHRIGESVNLTLVKGGVITGTVTNANGDAIAGVGVRAVRVRKPTDRQRDTFNFARDRMTDDRGVYRLFGLEPGTYVVAIGNSAPFYGTLNPFDENAPTYYPSATRDTAAELIVRAGEELTGIDVRYRGERGYTLSGFISGNMGETDSRINGITVSLSQAATGTPEATTFVGGDNRRFPFALIGVADGEYNLTSARGIGNTGEAMMTTRRITVRGADITGIELKLEPLGALTGNVTLEPPPKANCPNTRTSALEEIVITASPDEKKKDEEQTIPFFFFRRAPTAPDDKGAFRMLNLRSGKYHLNIELPGDDWFVRSIAMPVAPTTDTGKPVAGATGAGKQVAQSKTILPGAFTLHAGERINGLAVTIGQGAAAVCGRIKAGSEGVNLPAGLRVHLVPVEAERAADVLRYMEATVEKDGSFALGGIAPGSYWVLARPRPAVETDDAERRAVALSTDARNQLRREAESAGVKIVLQPCQRLADYVLNYVATPPKPQPPVR